MKWGSRSTTRAFPTARTRNARASRRSTRWAPGRTERRSPIARVRAPPPAAPACAAVGSRGGGDFMPRVVGIDHLVLSVGDFGRSKAFYGKLLGFLGFKLKHSY